MRKVLIAVLGAFVLLSLTPAVSSVSAAPKKCKKFKPVEPDSASSEAGEATEQKVVKVTSKATEEKPVTLEFDHGPGMWLTADAPPIAEDSVFFNFQAEPKKLAKLNVRIEWASPSPSDIDLYVYDQAGLALDESTTYNPVPQLTDNDDGDGFEQIVDLAAVRCAGFTVESRVSSSLGEAMTIKVWLS